MDEANKVAINKYMSSDKFIIEENVNLTINNINLKEYQINEGAYDFIYDVSRGLYYIKL